MKADDQETPEQQSVAAEPPAWATDDEIETFYRDNIEIMSLLLGVIQATSYDLSEATEIYKHHAKYFWAPARGEQTEGHPDYRPHPPELH